MPVNLREPQKLSLGLFLDFNRGDEEAGYLDKLLHFIRLYHSRSFLLRRLKRQGSESSHETRLWDLGQNAWSVLRNLHDKRSVDGRYDTIMRYMAEAFPVFDDIVLEQTGRPPCTPVSWKRVAGAQSWHPGCQMGSCNFCFF